MRTDPSMYGLVLVGSSKLSIFSLKLGSIACCREKRGKTSERRGKRAI